MDIAEEVLEMTHQQKETLASEIVSPLMLKNLAPYIIPGENIVLEETIGQGLK